ncbi:MAG: Gldg family protein [Acidobacteria bacterium]|nr:Gldg family protein [Acidobacteriota bacterium]
MKEKISNILGLIGFLGAIAGWILYSLYPDKTILVSVLEVVVLGFLFYYFITHFTRLTAFSKKRSARMGANAVLMTLFFIGILIVLAVLLSKHHLRFDFSEERKFSLSPQTVKILKNLKKDIKITGFVDERTKSREEAVDLLNSFKYQTPKIQYELVDPGKRPAIAKQYGITQSDTLVLEGGKQEKRVRAINEEELINAIVQVNQDQKKVIYFLEGHGEHKIKDPEKEGYSFAKDALEKDGYEVKSLLMLQEGKVPEDSSVLVVGGPMTMVLPSEKTGLENYLNKGGKVLFLIDPESKSDFEGFLEKWGVALQKDLIIDPLSRLFGGDFTIPVVNSYPLHDITREMKAPVFFPVARSFSFMKEKEGEINYSPLAESGPNSWGETKIQSGEARFDPGEDFKGPVTIAGAFTFKKKSETDPEKPSKWIVAGDSDFATNAFLKAAGNSDLFLNMVSWLAEEKGLISVRSTPSKTGPLFLTSTQGKLFFFVPILIVPGLVLIIGITVWIKRKRK